MINWRAFAPTADRSLRGYYFEELCYYVIQRLHGRVTRAGRDGGVDFIADSRLGNCTWQVKFFEGGRLDPTRRRQIEQSLVEHVRSNPKVNKWLLITPLDLTPTEFDWFQSKLSSMAPGVTLEYWGGTELSQYLLGLEGITNALPILSFFELDRSWLSPLVSDVLSRALRSSTEQLINTSMVPVGTDTICHRLEQIITAFEELIISEPAEEECQRFLRDNPVLLSPIAHAVIPKVRLGSDFTTDFVIQLDKRSYILVELERPSHRLFTRDGNPTSELTHAQRQVEDWRQWVAENLHYARHSMPDILEPECWVIIGRHSSLDETTIRSLSRKNEELHRIRIKTYDDLLDTAKRHVRNLQRLMR